MAKRRTAMTPNQLMQTDVGFASTADQPNRCPNQRADLHSRVDAIRLGAWNCRKQNVRRSTR